MSATRWLGVVCCVATGQGCTRAPEVADGAESRRAVAAADSGFAGVQVRGREAMGVDQYTFTHRFEPLPDGGRIELQRDTADSAGRAPILAHMEGIATACPARGSWRPAGQRSAMEWRVCREARRFG